MKMLRLLAAAAWAPVLLWAAAPPGDCSGKSGCEQLARPVAVEEDALGGGFSMLQLGAQHASSAANHEQHQRSGGGGEIPATTTFRDVTMLHLKLPLSPTVRSEDMVGAPLGFRLDPEASAHLRIAYFPDALLGWSAGFGDSTPENVPHHLLTVRLPMLVGGERVYQAGYALIDDDVAMMLTRLGHGVPAKLANISFPASSGSFPEGQMINISRRGVNLLRVEGMHSDGEADLEAVEKIFQHPELNFGTDISALMDLPSMPFKKHVTKASVKAAWKVKASLSTTDGKYEVLGGMFSSLEPLEAYWLKADLDVTTSLVARTPSAFSLAPALGDSFFNSRFRGEVTTDKRGRRVDFPRMAYKNGNVIWTHMHISEEKVAPYLPPPLKVAGDVGVLWHTRWEPADVFNMWGILDQQADFFPLEYNELWVTVPVTLHGKRYMYPILMMLDEDIGAVTGQDLMGCPKKLANLTYTFSPKPGPNSTVFLDISRRGRPVVQLSGKITDRKQGPAWGVNDHRLPESDILWLISHQFPWNPEMDRPHILPCQSVERTYDQREMTDIEVTLGDSALAPLAEWFVGPPIAGGYIKMDQDWMASHRASLSHLMLPMDADGFAPWWKRSFSLLYM